MQLLVLLDMLLIILQLTRMIEIYGSVSIMLIATQYKHHMNLTEFVGKLFVIVHFTVLV